MQLLLHDITIDYEHFDIPLPTFNRLQLIYQMLEIQFLIKLQKRNTIGTHT